MKGATTHKRPRGSAPDLVIFDCDGVLVDSEPLAIAVLTETLAKQGVRLDATQAYERFLGRSFSTMTAILREDFELDLAPETVAGMRAQLFAQFEQALQPVAGIASVLAQLDLPICVASSSQPERIALSLKLTGLTPYFGNHVFSATMVESGKPAPDLFLFAAGQMGFAAERCLVIEDSPAGISAAKAAGMKVLGFTGGGHAEPAGLEKKLAMLDPDYIFADMQMLPDLLHSQRLFGE